MSFTIAVDFDGTCVDHRFPAVGSTVPGAVKWLHKFVAAGAQLILLTMRSDGPACGNTLTDAVQWFNTRNIPLFGVNVNPTQHAWTTSPKVYATVYIDDAAIGCPLRTNPRGGLPYVDWEIVGPLVLQQLTG